MVPRSSAALHLVTALLLPLGLACGEAMSEENEALSLREGAEAVAPLVEAGTTVELRLQGALSTKDEIQGRGFTAVVVYDVLGSDGSVLIPSGATVSGRVAEARRSDDPDRAAVLVLQPEAVVIAGSSHPLAATVVESAVEAETRDEVSETATKVGVGAAAGAALGKIIGGDNSDAVKGAVVGAAAGGVVAHVTRPGHAELDDGARLLIRLDQPLVLR